MRTNLRRFAFTIFLVMACSLVGLAQSRKVTGTVKDAEGLEVIGATVTVPGTKAAAITDVDGKYSIDVPSGAKQIKVTYVGSKDAVIDIGNRDVIDVVMTESDQSLDEVVAIGYAKVRKADLTGATASVSAEDLASRPVATAAEALAGKAAGVNIVSQSGAPGADINITVRGGTSITQSTTPLYIVDGFELENALQQIDINDIETIDDCQYGLSLPLSVSFEDPALQESFLRIYHGKAHILGR